MRYSFHKIPGRVGQVPVRTLKSGSIRKLKPFLVCLDDDVSLPAVESPKFPRAFREACGAFLDKNWQNTIADRMYQLSPKTWVICSLGEPAWVLIKR